MNIQEIIADMRQQLKDKGQLNSLTEDQVANYEALYYIRQALYTDIEDNGVSAIYRYDPETGDPQYKKNDRIAELLKVVTQMNKIIYDLGIRTRDLRADDIAMDI